MREPRPIKGARAPLLDRLADDPTDPRQETEPFRILNREELRSSVRREVARILNTRCPFPGGPLDENDRTVLDYGIPDFSHFTAAREADCEHLAGIIVRAVSAYEPRLRGVTMRLRPDPRSPGSLLGTLEAQLLVESVDEHVSFPVAILDRSAGVDVGS